MKHLLRFNENIEIDWSKPEKEIGKLVLDEVNRIHKKVFSGVTRTIFGGTDLEWSDTPRQEFEYKDGKLVKIGERKVFLKLSKSVKEELEELIYIEEVYDLLMDRFEDVSDFSKHDVDILLKWNFSPNFKSKNELEFLIDFEFFNLDLLSLSDSIQLIVEIVGKSNIVNWSILEKENSKRLRVYFEVKK